MKKLSLIMLVVFAAWGFQACKNKAKDSTSTADSANEAKDTAKTTAKENISVDQNDAKFVVTAAADGMAEVNLGKVAEVKASSTRVKNFAAMMVTDHSKAGNALADLAKSKNITLPTAPDTSAQQKAQKLAKKSGKDFDKDYVDAMVDGHKKAVKLFEDASQNLKDPDLKAFAIKTLPTLKMHLDSINAIHDSMK
jgi:putative membrane protein